MEMLFIDMGTTETKVDFGQNPRASETLKLSCLEKWRWQVCTVVCNSIQSSWERSELQIHRTGGLAGNRRCPKRWWMGSNETQQSRLQKHLHVCLKNSCPWKSVGVRLLGLRSKEKNQSGTKCIRSKSRERSQVWRVDDVWVLSRLTLFSFLS